MSRMFGFTSSVSPPVLRTHWIPWACLPAVGLVAGRRIALTLGLVIMPKLEPKLKLKPKATIRRSRSSVHPRSASSFRRSLILDYRTVDSPVGLAKVREKGSERTRHARTSHIFSSRVDRLPAQRRLRPGVQPSTAPPGRLRTQIGHFALQSHPTDTRPIEPT